MVNKLFARTVRTETHLYHYIIIRETLYLNCNTGNIHSHDKIALHPRATRVKSDSKQTKMLLTKKAD